VSGQWWNDDEQLLAALGEALRAADEVPRQFVDAGKAVYTWHNVDAELAALTFDSASESAGRVPALTRTEMAPLRALTFASPRLSIHLEVTRDALHGQVVPEQAGEIELRPATGAPTTIEVDEVGWFVIRPAPSGAFRLRCHTAAGTAVLTDWITL
jgi:hypothetical protein